MCCTYRKYIFAQKRSDQVAIKSVIVAIFILYMNTNAVRVRISGKSYVGINLF